MNDSNQEQHQDAHLAVLPAMGTVVKTTIAGRVRRSAAAIALWSLSSALASSSASRCRSCWALNSDCCHAFHIWLQHAS